LQFGRRLRGAVADADRAEVRHLVSIATPQIIRG
jgi:hypothetical protein